MGKSSYTDFLSYPLELRSLNSINITQREVDIIACVINRRMTDPSIAHQLGINKRTVETHLRNLTQKLRCSLQTLNNIVEASGKNHLFSNHYAQLLIFKQFRDVLDKLTNIRHLPLKRCTVFYTDASLLQILNMIKPYILHFGIDLSIDIFDPILISDSLRRSNHYLIIVNKDLSIVPEADHIRCIDKTSFSTHTAFLMDIAEKLNDNKEVNDLIHQFNIKTKNRVLTQELSLPFPSAKQELMSMLIGNSSKILNKLHWIYFAVFISASVALWIGNAQITIIDYPRSELYLPSKPLLLNRNYLVTTIQKQLYEKASESNINCIAICGIGGAGKTILSRMVARQHKGIVWEFNAETETSLRASMKEFAYTLGQSDEDRARLKFIFTLTNVEEQSKQISIFVRNKLRKNPKWLIIFDNVESFSIVHPYLPTDPLVWGIGHVIITSRNSHFPSLEPNKIVKLDFLTKQEAVQLFSQTRWGQRLDDSLAKKELMLFLDKIPACPLDVVIAANFLRQSPELDYEQYLNRLNDNAFQLDHADRLLTNSEYTQTRHDIISVSLERLLSNPTFLQVMVLIGLLDSQNIPKPLLIKITDSASVERIIYELKKYSLIIEDAKLNGMAIFSMHQTIHSTLSNYIFKYLNPNSYEHLVETAIEVFESYASEILDSANYTSISAIISHTERMLSKNHLSKFLRSVLEITYVNLLSAIPAHSIKVIPLLERSLSYLETHPKKSREISLRIARATSLLGDRYRSLSRLIEAREMLEKSINLFERLSPDSIDTAKTYGRLGTLYRTEGNHQKAQELFLKAVEIYNKYPTSYHPMDKLISLGLNSRDVGDYQKSLDYLTTNLNQVKDKNDPWRFWILSYMGTVYIDTCNYDKAWDCFQQADQYFSHASAGQTNEVPYAWRLAYMGTTQALSGKPQDALVTLQKSLNVFASITAGRDMHSVCFKVVLPALGYAHFLQGNYEKAQEYFKESLMHLEKHYGKKHFQTGRVLCYLGLVAWKTNHYVESERLLMTAIDVFNTYEHIDVFYPLEGLSDLFYDRYLKATKDNYLNEAELYKDKSKKYLLAALDVVRKYLPCDSGHLSRIKEKIKKR